MLALSGQKIAFPVFVSLNLIEISPRTKPEQANLSFALNSGFKKMVKGHFPQ